MAKDESKNPTTIIKDENGYVIAEIHGELDVEALTRCLYGFKQKVEEPTEEIQNKK